MVTLAGTVGGWLVGRRFGGVIGGLLVAALLVVAPPLDLFSFQVIADTPALALTVLALGLATLPGTVAAVAAGVVFGAALSVKLTALTVAPAALWLLWRRLRPAIAGFAGTLLALCSLTHDAPGDSVVKRRHLPRPGTLDARRDPASAPPDLRSDPALDTRSSGSRSSRLS